MNPLVSFSDGQGSSQCSFCNAGFCSKWQTPLATKQRNCLVMSYLYTFRRKCWRDHIIQHGSGQCTEDVGSLFGRATHLVLIGQLWLIMRRGVHWAFWLGGQECTLPPSGVLHLGRVDREGSFLFGRGPYDTPLCTFLCVYSHSLFCVCTHMHFFGTLWCSEQCSVQKNPHKNKVCV